MTTTAVAPVDLFAVALRVHPGGAVLAGERRGASGDAWHVATFRAETDADVHADHWEMHPEGDEAVCCLTGGVRMFVRTGGTGGPDGPGGDVREVSVAAGSAVIVPRGCWHRLELDVPSTLMAITLRAGTRRERRAG